MLGAPQTPSQDDDGRRALSRVETNKRAAAEIEGDGYLAEESPAAQPHHGFPDEPPSPRRFEGAQARVHRLSGMVVRELGELNQAQVPRVRPQAVEKVLHEVRKVDPIVVLLHGALPAKMALEEALLHGVVPTTAVKGERRQKTAQRLDVRGGSAARRVRADLQTQFEERQSGNERRVER